MKCAHCDLENPAVARFCGGCGAPLEVVCGACRAANPPGNRFCHQCGAPLTTTAATGPFASPRAYTPKHLAEKILTTSAALTGERKQVTVLFVDVSGFTSLSERLDPEEVHRLMSRAFDLMLAAVHRYEGTVNQFLGDGIMALFGAPIAHEDHARRAVHAALGITAALEGYQKELAARGISFRVRQGLNTGLVVVGSIGSDLRMDYTAVGDTTNVAARLQQLSEPGQVTISEATHRLIHGFFETRPLGTMHLKGRTEPLAVWHVVAAHEGRTRLEVEADRGLTPFIGRERELNLLQESFARARSGQGQVVFVVGEPGIGKSRLVHELRQRLGPQADWLEGHCLSFGRAMTFHPLVDLIRRWCGVKEGDGDGVIAAKIDHAVATYGLDVSSITPYLRALLSVDPGDAEVRGMTPAQRRGETFDALRRLLVRAAERRPQVLVIEDLHWIDSTSEQFLTALVDSAPAIPLLVLCTYRPGYVSPFGERSYFTRIVPAALSPEESTRMAASVLAADMLPAELRALVTAKAEGNPFYVEELVKSLEETGALRRVAGRLEVARPVIDTEIPGTLQDLIAARIDRLADAPKRTLQLAAVIGREFTRRLVDRLAEIRERTEEFLRELTALELIYERHLFPELAYMFKHALTQDVAYGSLLVQRRKELHGRTGLAIEELYADRLPEHYEVLAHHFLRAEHWEQALEYLLKAADKAAQSFGLRQALELYGQALEATERLGERASVATVMTIHRARADLFFGIGDFERSRAEGETLATLAARVQDRAAEAAARVQIASALQWAEDLPAALEQTREAIAIAEPIGAAAPLSGAFFVRGYVESVSGRLDAAEADLGRAYNIARTVQDANRQALALNLLGLRRSWQGDYQGGRTLNDQGTRIARQHRLVIPLLRCLWVRGLVSSELGEYDPALAEFAEGLMLAEKIGDDAFVPRFLNTIGWLRLECGDFAQGMELSERAYELTNRSSRAGHGTGAERRAFIRNNEADALMARGDLAGAAAALEEAEHIVRHPPPSRWMTWRYGSHCYAALGQLALLNADPGRARRMADQALEMATPTGSRKYESWAWRLKGESATAERVWDEAEQALGRALTIAQTIGHVRQTWMSEVALGRLYTARGRQQDARRHYDAAWTTISGIRVRTQDPGLQIGLDSSPVSREVEGVVKSE